MGLLDPTDDARQGGYRGLLDSLLYRSPLAAPLPEPNFALPEYYTAELLQEPDPFGPVPRSLAPMPAAAPFAFAGPGSMQVDPSMLSPPPSGFGAGAKPVPFAPGAETAQPPAGKPITLSVNRPPAATRATAPDSYVPIGKQADGSTYHMPMFGEADAPAAPDAAAPASASGAPGMADRLSRAAAGFVGNLDHGPVGALAGGLGALVTGRNTDPWSIEAEKSNATATALLGKGVPLADVQAATNNPDLMKALISQVYGRDNSRLRNAPVQTSGKLSPNTIRPMLMPRV